MLYSLAKQFLNHTKTKPSRNIKGQYLRKTHRRVSFRKNPNIVLRKSYNARHRTRRSHRLRGGIGKTSSNGSAVNEVGNNEQIIGRFYANWCGHCQRMAADWQKIEAKLKDTFKNYSYFNIEHGDNMEEHKKKLDDHIDGTVKVSGFPTIFKVINRKIEYFNAANTPGNTFYKKLLNFYTENPKI